MKYEINNNLFDADKDVEQRQSKTLEELEEDFQFLQAVPACTTCKAGRVRAYRSRHFQHYEVCKKHPTCMLRQHLAHLPPEEEPISEFEDQGFESAERDVHYKEQIPHSWRTCTDPLHPHCIEYRAEAARGRLHRKLQAKRKKYPPTRKIVDVSTLKIKNTLLQSIKSRLPKATPTPAYRWPSEPCPREAYRLSFMS